MRRKPIELAAVATAAVPGLTPTAVSSAPDDPADFDSALLLDSEGKRWRVRSPRHAEASARLETEFMVLRAFVPAIRAELPFLMPTVAGTVRQGELSTFVYSHLAGTTRSVEELSNGPAALAKEIGAALAAIHDLPRSLVSNADLPSYTPNEFRQRRLNELDQAATTGKIPSLLLRRWEHAMEDVSLWRFHPCVVHGDMHEDNLLVDGDRVTAVTGWTDLRIGDPADDMAWLVASNEQSFVDAVQKHYCASRRNATDAHLLRRAALSAEFALAQYLVKGLAAGNQGMIDEAESMLTALAEDVAEYGGQPISVEPLPQPVTAPGPAGPHHPGAAPVQAASAGGKVTLLPPASAPVAGTAPTGSTLPGVPVRPAVSKVTLIPQPPAGADPARAGDGSPQVVSGDGAPGSTLSGSAPGNTGGSAPGSTGGSAAADQEPDKEPAPESAPESPEAGNGTAKPPAAAGGEPARPAAAVRAVPASDSPADGTATDDTATDSTVTDDTVTSAIPVIEVKSP